MKKTIELKVFKGKEIDYNASGQPKNPQQKITLTYGDLQYPKHLANLNNLGICRVEVVALYDDKGDKKDKEGNSYLTDAIVKETMEMIYNEPVKELTPEQKQIAELTARLDAYTNQATDAKIETSPELKEARAEYEKVAGKKGSPKWSIEEVLAKTEELKNKN